MKIALYARVIHDQDIPFFKKLFECFKRNNITALVHENICDIAKDKLQGVSITHTFKVYKDLIKARVTCLITLGGDGTLLDTSLLVRDSNIPILGINMGKLGFLAHTAKEDLEEAVQTIINQDFELEKRSLLQLESNMEGLFGATNYALNDFTLHKKDTSSMIKILAYIDGEFLNAYWADGIVVATPTGSTAYSLSCGGPIIFPGSDNFVITPVAPHNLNVRPVVVSDDSVITFKIEEDMGKKILCTLDSRFKSIDASYKLTVKKAGFSINLIKLKNADFSQTLRNKLAWGLDKRN